MAKLLFTAMAIVPLVTTAPARAHELDLNLGLQATHTAWDGDIGGGPTLAVGWFFRPWIAANFTMKGQYAKIDERYLSYFSLNVIARKRWDRVRLAAGLGAVHQHEETMEVIKAMPIASLFGVADGIRHRMGGRIGAQLAIPFRKHARGDWYVAFDLDATVFSEQTRGPRWMSSAGLSIGVAHDFDQRASR